MSFDEQPDKDYKWDIHYHDYSTEHKVRVIAHCKHCARCRFERKNTDCVVLAVAPVADEQPDGDIYGERAAESEPSELSAFEKWWAMLSKVPYMSKKEIAERAFYAGETASHELRFDACRPYLKDGETVADALNRMQKEVTTLRNAAMQLWADRRTFDKGNDMNLGDLFDKRDKQADEDRKDAARYRLLRHGQHWSVIDGIGDALRAETLDAAIDMEMTGSKVAG